MPDALHEYLSLHEEAFVSACESILRSPVPPDSAYGLFWFQIDDTEWTRLPIALAWCDQDQGCDVQYPSPLTSIPSIGGLPSQGLDDHTAGEHVFHWIFRCWNKIGGAKSLLPFYCHNYHTLEHYCLRRGRFVTEEEMTTLAE